MYLKLEFENGGFACLDSKEIDEIFKEFDDYPVRIVVRTGKPGKSVDPDSDFVYIPHNE